MSNQEYVEIPIPKEEYEELAKLAKKLGYASVDEFAERAFQKHLEKVEAEAK